MRLRSRWTRTVTSATLVALCGVGCDTVLDIQAPKMRPNAGGGEGGEAPPPTAAIGAGAGAGTSGNVSMPSGGEGGAESVAVLAGAGAGGEVVTPVPKDCEPDAVRCGSDAAGKTPQICDETGHWLANTDEADGDCPVLCDAGKCVDCVAPAARCAPCKDDDASCSTNQPQTCVDGAWVNQGDKPCLQFCDAGICKTAPSCNAANKDRTTCPGNRSCCESLLVPGGDFTLVDVDAHTSSPAKVGAFLLDKFEVTVGRMRQFVNAFDQIKLKSGDGMSKHINGDPGWDTSYELPINRDVLVTQLKCAGTTWSDALIDNNDLPVNCVSFSVAYAFCIWDQGRLPTEAEWNFAAAGGTEARAYPWPAPAIGPAITNEYANYDNALGGPAAVGVTSKGDGRWLHSDLAGNVAEWALDFHGDYPTRCDNCLNTTPNAERIYRGGGYTMPDGLLLTSFRGYAEPNQRFSVLGFRCARDPNLN